MPELESAVEAYSAAFQSLSAEFARHWDVVDWEDAPITWRFFRRAGAALPQQGWKIHVSAAAVECLQLFSALLVPLRDLQATFKAPRRLDDVVFLNSGDAGIELLGKIITIYPANVDHARALISRLDLVWPASRGPEVQTDLHVRPGSAVSFRFGVFGAGPQVISSTGLHEFALALPDGSLVPDTRRLGGEQPRNAPLPPVPSVPPTLCPLRVEGEFHLDDRRYFIMTELAKSPRGKVFLAADVDRLETVVLKVGRPGVAGDAVGVDIRDLLRKEWLVLSSLEEQPGLAPRALGWSAVDWPTLVMEDFRGPVLSELPRRDRIRWLPQLAAAIARVHAAGYVHGDVKLENAVLRGDRVGLIDFELAAREGESMTRTAGTNGHIAPEVPARAKAAFSRDVFALAGCVIHAILDIPPGLLPAGPGRTGALLRNEGAARAANLVAAFAAPDPAARPTASAAAAALAAQVDLVTDLEPPAARPARRTDSSWFKRASVEAGQLTRAYAQNLREGTCWGNSHFMKAFTCEGINIGAAGIILGLITIDAALGRSDSTDQIDQGARWLSARPASGNAAGLFTGNAGVALALAVAGLRLGRPEYCEAARRRFEAASATRHEVDLFSGSAGVVWASCLLSDIFENDWPLHLAAESVRHIQAQAGVEHGIPIWSVDPESAYLGCAHGSAGVALALGSWGHRTGEQSCSDTALLAFRRIRAHGTTQDDSALRITTKTHHHHAVGNWCHGVAGYLWSILQGVGDHPAVRLEIDWAAACLRDAPSVGTPTYCHGLAGQLELWRMLGGIPRFESLAAARADKVASALRIMHHKVDGKCAWTSDDPTIVTPDLWIGFLGPATAASLHAVRAGAPLLSGAWLSACAHPSRQTATGSLLGLRRLEHPAERQHGCLGGIPLSSY